MAYIDVPSYADMPAPTDDERRLAYEVGARSRATEEHIVRLVSRGEVKFAIWGPGEEIHGTPDPCDDCKNAPADSIDIMTGKIDHGDVLRCDEDALVYEVRRIDRHDQRAELETLPGYPKKTRTMRLALDGSPARRSFTDDRREPLWFRVGK